MTVPESTHTFDSSKTGLLINTGKLTDNCNSCNANEDGFNEWLRNIVKLLCDKFVSRAGFSVGNCHDNSYNSDVILKFGDLPYFGVQLKTERVPVNRHIFQFRMYLSEPNDRYRMLCAWVPVLVK